MIGKQNKALSSSKTANTPKKPAVKKVVMKTARGNEYSADEDWIDMFLIMIYYVWQLSGSNLTQMF